MLLSVFDWPMRMCIMLLSVFDWPMRICIMLLSVFDWPTNWPCGNVYHVAKCI